MVKGGVMEFEDKIPLQHVAHKPNLVLEKSF